MLRARPALLALLLVSLVPLGCSKKGKDNEFQTIARKALEAYKNKDIDAIGKLIPADKVDRMKSRMKKGSRGWERMFGAKSKRYETVAKWDGKLGETRVKGKRVRVKFGANDKSVFVVDLRMKDGKVYFRGVRRSSKDRWAKWGELKK